VIEIRWHARAGQGAKTAAQLEAMAMLRAGRWVQAFPEYGPERSGAPMLAYTRVDDARIRRRYAVTSPDVVVVLDPSLLLEADVTAGLAHDGRLLINTSREPADVAAELRCEADVRCVPAGDIAAAHDSRYVNVVMLGALAGVLREPPLQPPHHPAAPASRPSCKRPNQGSRKFPSPS
jgi:2-oxoacid:acceptor oxidoreductase, gamma subunit, pyruvate/2-ketoisovalerate family